MALDTTDPTARRRRPAIADGVGAAPAAATAIPGPHDAQVGPPPPNSVNGAAFSVPVQKSAPAALPAAPPAAQPAPLLTQQRAAPAIAQGASDQIDAAALNAIGRNNNMTGPGSADAETMRRIEIASKGSIGSPSSRQAIMGALAGTLTANRGITAAATQQQGQVLAAGATAEQNQNAAAQDAEAKQRLQELTGSQQTGIEGMRQAGDTQRTGMTEAGASARSNAGIAGNIKIAEIGKAPTPTYQTNQDGSISLVDGVSANPVQTADGKPYTPQKASDKLTLPQLFEGYNERVKAINSSYQTADIKQQQLAALQAEPLYAPLLASQQQGAEAAKGTPAAKVPAGAPTARNPKTGERMFQNPATGQWEPIL